MMRFDGQIIVVVGAASEIGAAVAHRFSAEGGTVVGIDVHEHQVGDVSMRADFTDEQAVIDVYRNIKSRYDRLDVVYNNVGSMGPGDGNIFESSVKVWKRAIDVNLTAIMLSCKHAVPVMRESEPGGGSIINAASFLGAIGAATAPMGYSAAKAAVIQLTRDLGVHLARTGIRVNAVSFGPIGTTTQRALLEQTPEIMPGRIVHWPMGRYGTLDEATGLIAFLASEDAGFITAQAIALDGGITQAFTVPD